MSMFFFQTDYVRNDLFKDYECDPSFKYLPPVIPNGLIHPVKLVDVYSPASVYLQFVQSIGKLKKLMRKLKLVITSLELEKIK